VGNEKRGGETSKQKLKQHRGHSRQKAPQSHFSSSPSRAGVEGCPQARRQGTLPLCFRIETPPVSWLGRRPSEKGLRLGLPIPESNREDLLPGQWLAPKNFSALQSRGGDGFSPSSRCAESPVIVDGVTAKI
jgi:hypothetical protein